MDTLRDAWRSKNLVYRAVEDNDEDLAFMISLRSDPVYLGLSSKAIIRPQTAKSVREYMRVFPTNILGAIICLPTAEQSNIESSDHQPSQASSSKGTPIGFVALFDLHPEALGIHRDAFLAISLAEPYRNKGHGTEAMNFALDFAFRRANLHRVALEAFSFNKRALRVYQKVGFVVEGRMRENHFLDRLLWGF
ncbi:GNAT family N-acetyltransferase [Aspergillus clavatus NRRL 1]|uniref:GNAT family acetyltransferase, putative n=1 Tax=Aspergillus clavatus (strain ATCC 1007 / CBS 513.65 / DSM 816 / NCTC 3887 / NRRL 1 / QM 1276 / 107) TaxID=344612 RepID=A1CGK1_ASPCL|nr:GNAT family acetyltransferase, putative [Aspergillus clavatus NRRL 1]EAW11081.1 GNAT family acetyltransferase, putative [Aspergillus clavatus NRRL 1]